MKPCTPATHPKLAAELKRFAKRINSQKFPTPKEIADAKRTLGRK